MAEDEKRERKALKERAESKAFKERAVSAFEAWLAAAPPNEKRNMSLLDKKIKQHSGWTTRILSGDKVRADPHILGLWADEVGVKLEWLIQGRGPREAPPGPRVTAFEKVLEEYERAHGRLSVEARMRAHQECEKFTSTEHIRQVIGYWAITSPSPRPPQLPVASKGRALKPKGG